MYHLSQKFHQEQDLAGSLNLCREELPRLGAGHLFLALKNDLPLPEKAIDCLTSLACGDLWQAWGKVSSLSSEHKELGRALEEADVLDLLAKAVAEGASSLAEIKSPGKRWTVEAGFSALLGAMITAHWALQRDLLPVLSELDSTPLDLVGPFFRPFLGLTFLTPEEAPAWLPPYREAVRAAQEAMARGDDPRPHLREALRVLLG